MEAQTMSMDNLLSLVEQYAEARQLAEAAQAEMDALKAQISAEMTRREVDKLDVGSHKVSVSTITTSRIDSKALKAAFPDVAAQFTKTTTSSRFIVA
jgi:predicted phage-related endonuclease